MLIWRIAHPLLKQPCKMLRIFKTQCVSNFIHRFIIIKHPILSHVYNFALYASISLKKRVKLHF